MDRKKIEELIRLVEESEISELTVKGPLSSVKIVKEAPSVVAPVVAAHAPPAAVQTRPGSRRLGRGDVQNRRPRLRTRTDRIADGRDILRVAVTGLARRTSDRAIT